MGALMMGSYLLRAESLRSKFGFGDGDMFGGDEFDHYLGDWHHHTLLIPAVRKYLAPLLDPRVELEEIGSIHNPIRVTNETRKLIDAAIEIEITADQAREAMKEFEPDIWADCEKRGM